MEINRDALKWLLKVTDSDVDDLVKWLRRWQRKPTVKWPCITSPIGVYKKRYVIGWSDEQRWINQAEDIIFFNENTKLVNNLTPGDVRDKFVGDPSFRRELIDTLRKINLED